MPSSAAPATAAELAPRTPARATPADSAVPAIELVEATKRYGDQVALDRVSLRIEPGEFFCLLGPSGCGKTTTLNLIGGFIPLTAGELRIEGRRVNDVPPHKRNVNTVFQNYALFPHLSVGDNVAFGLRMEGLKGDEVRRRVEEYLGLVGLEAYRDRYPAQLSGGQQQRVALARALVKRPAVLLLDEPLGALDLKLRKQMQVELARIHRQVRTTFVFVTHDQEEALSLGTRIAVMSGGHVIQMGPPREIYYRPVDRFVADFIGESNFVSGTVAIRDGSPRLTVVGGEELPAPAGLGPGETTLMIRPESIDVGREVRAGEAEGLAVLRGRVVGVSFLGAYTRVTVQTAVGPIVSTRFHAAGPASRAFEELLDQEVCVWWSPTDAVVTAR
ncbi:MAG TPA: ABC transporter ATP-binding protein [Candidatus Limnocylindrales bacterium]